MILANVPAFYFGASPNKFFDHLACGIPILVNYPGWMAESVEQYGMGCVVPPDTASEFGSALCQLADDVPERKAMGERARKLAEPEFRRDVLVARLVDLLHSEAGIQWPFRASASVVDTQDSGS